MNKLIENTNLNINSWLVNCGLMYGNFDDGIIYTTKFTILQWLIGICLTIFHIIKSIIFLSVSKDSKMANLLGDWTFVYGPRSLVALIILFSEIFVLSIFIIFYFSSKYPKKMLFWLEQMEFDPFTRRFSKLNFNQTDLRAFTRKISFLRIIYSIFVYSLIVFFFITANLSVFKRIKSYYFHYFISILMFCPMFYINISCIYVFLVIFYQVNQ